MAEPDRPSVALVFGSVTPPQSDLVELFVHLGASKEVSSYEVKLHNHDGKYSRNGVSPILEGMSGSISLGRGSSCPLLITLKVEDVEDSTSPDQCYFTVSGRCWGSKLFAKTVTKSYVGQKGEAIVKDLIDNYVGLSHNRNGVELIEDTDTTYSQLDYEDSPVWDVLKYIAETADKAGVIGYSFRVAPDGKFEFFAKNNKTNPLVISENIDVQVKYRRNIARIRNKIIIKGIADKSAPADKVSWTRSLTPADGLWEAVSGVIGTDVGPDGDVCVRLEANSLYYGAALFTLHAGREVNCGLYPTFDVQLKLDSTYSGNGLLVLFDATGKQASKSITVSPDANWHSIEVGVGLQYAKQWDTIDGGFDWSRIWRVRFNFYFSENVGTGSFYVHGLYFGGCRYSAVVEDLASQAAYTDGSAREYVETDEELWSDNECLLRAKALLAYLKDPAEYLSVESTLLDFGAIPVLAGDKVSVNLPLKGINGDFEVKSVEYHVPMGAEVLETTLELGKEPPKMADYLYGLRAFTVNVEKLSRTKIGKRGIPVATQGGAAGASSYFNSNVEIDKTAPVLNLLTGRTHKSALGFDGANTFLAAYTGDLILNSALNHLIRPNSDGSDDLGNAAFRFGSLHLKNKLYVAGWEVVSDTGRINMHSMPRDAAGLVLEAQGAEFYPMYVNPNYRYMPAAHQHSADDLTSGGVTADVEVAKVGGGTRTLHFVNSRYTGYTDS